MKLKYTFTRMISIKLISPTDATLHILLLCCCSLLFRISSCGEEGDKPATNKGGESWPSSIFRQSYDHLRPSSSSDDLVNEIPRLPVWNGNEQRQIDFTQLFEMMGEPRGSRGRELSELIMRPRPKCNRRIKILNGVTRIRDVSDVKKSGCRPLRRPVNGDVRQSIGGAVAAFFCSPNAVLIGNAVIYCDGIKWNGTEPACHVESPTTTTPSTTTVSEEDEAERDWDTNLQISESEASTDRTLSGALSDTSAGDGDSSSEYTNALTDDILPSTTPATHEVHQVFNQTFEEGVTKKEEKSLETLASITTRYEISAGETVGQSETSTEAESVLTSTSRSSFANLDSGTPSPELEVAKAASQSPSIEVPMAILPITSQSETFSTTLAPTSASSFPLDSESLTTPRPTYPLTTRRFKILTRRPRPLRPLITRKPGKRPFRRRYRPTTTVKPGLPRLPPRKQDKVTFRPRSTPRSSSFPSPFLVPGESQQNNVEPGDYAIAIDKEFLPREHVEPIRPIQIRPDMLNINVSKFMTGGSRAEQAVQVAHSSMIGGIVLFVVGISTFFAGVVLYCWRKNKGIARARPCDMDGRTLSLHDANDDFMWLDQNQRDNSVL